VKHNITEKLQAVHNCPIFVTDHIDPSLITQWNIFKTRW